MDLDAFRAPGGHERAGRSVLPWRNGLRNLTAVRTPTDSRNVIIFLQSFYNSMTIEKILSAIIFLFYKGISMVEPVEEVEEV